MLTVTITIVNDKDNPHTEYEMGILHALTGGVAAPAPAAPTKAAPKAASAPKTEPVAEPTPEPEEDLLGGGEATLEDAVAKATALVAAGKTAQVKAALTTAGAKRVSELKGAAIAKFLESLDA